MQLVPDRSKYVEINRAQVRRRVKKHEEAQRAEAEKARIEAIGPIHDQPAPKYGQKYFTPSGLKSKLGWTDTLIVRFLGEPDETAPNPHYSNSGALMRLYSSHRVAAVESTAEVQMALAESEDRKTSASIGVRTKTGNMVRKMQEANITIKRGWTDEQIHELAVRTHGGNYAGNPAEFVWSSRKARAAIRHNLTNYESLWSVCNRGDTGQGAYEILRPRVDALIDEAYPQFAGDD